MPTECSAKPMGFARVAGRAVVADFDGGAITSNAGGLLLGATDRAIGLIERFAVCFAERAVDRVVHEVTTLVGQRVFGIALGDQDLIDHDRPRHGPGARPAGGRHDLGRMGPTRRRRADRADHATELSNQPRSRGPRLNWGHLLPGSNEGSLLDSRTEGGVS